jgi:MoaA/NifB/PqqE/SkfB family radical SAM enzyme
MGFNRWLEFILYLYVRLVRPERMPCLPLTIHMETTTQCNLACTMCPRTFALSRSDNQDRWHRNLSLEQFSSILRQFDRLRRIRLHGLGEPLMNPDLVAMISEASDRGIEVEFTTNAVLLSPAVSKSLIRSGLSYLTVSLDGATADTYERIRVGAQLDTVVENIGQLIRTRKQLNQRHPILSINMVVSRENLHELPDLLRLAKNLGIAEVRASPLELPSRELVAWVPDHSTWWEAASRAEHLARRLKIAFEDYGTSNQSQDSNSSPARRGISCTRPWLAPYIRLDGYVTPCCNISDWRILGGLNVFDRSFRSIWNSNQFQTFRHALKRDPLPSPCRQCPQR